MYSYKILARSLYIKELISFPNKFFFSHGQQQADPFFLLGAEKQEDFESIKKKYLKLATIYHPDKNPSPEAGKLFLQIKEAFESIKYMRGLTPNQALTSDKPQEDDNFQSVRPNADQYKENFEEDDRANIKMDFKEFAAKAPDGSEFNKFKHSAEVIESITSIKFNPESVGLPNTIDRFDLESSRKEQKFFTNTGYFYLFCFVMFLGCLFVLMGAGTKRIKEKKIDATLKDLVELDKFTGYYATNEEKQQEKLDNLIKNTYEYKQYTQNEDFEQKIARFKMMQQIPVHQDYVKNLSNKQGNTTTKC